MLLKDVILAVAADQKDADTVCFIGIESKESLATFTHTDDYGNQVTEGQKFLRGKFLERFGAKSLYRLAKKFTHFYKETIVYPCVQAILIKKGYAIADEELCEFYACVEANNGMSIF